MEVSVELAQWKRVVGTAHLTPQEVLSKKALMVLKAMDSSNPMKEIPGDTNTTTKRKGGAVEPAIGHDNQLVVQEVVVKTGSPSEFDPGEEGNQRKKNKTEETDEAWIWACTENKKEEREDKNKNPKLSSSFLIHIRLKAQCPFDCGLAETTLTKTRRVGQTEQRAKRRKHVVKTPVSFGRIENVRDGYRCEFCEYICETQEEMVVHQKGHPKPHKCKLCPQMIKGNTDLKVHMKRKHGMTRDCSICKRLFGSRRELEKHTLKKHGIRITERVGGNVYKVECPSCWQTFRSEKIRNHHRRKEHVGEVGRNLFKHCQDMKDYQETPETGEDHSKLLKHEVHNCPDHAQDSVDMNCWKCGQFLPMKNKKDFKTSRMHIAHHRQQVNPGQGMALMYRKLSMRGQDLNCPYEKCKFRATGLFVLYGHLIHDHHLFQEILKRGKVFNASQLEEISDLPKIQLLADEGKIWVRDSECPVHLCHICKERLRWETDTPFLVNHYVQHFINADHMVVWKVLMEFNQEKGLPTPNSKCPGCKRRENKWSDLEVHMIMEHELLDLMLMDEEIKDEKAVEVLVSETITTNQEFNQCPFCERLFESHLRLDQHLVKEWTSRNIRNRSCLHCTPQSQNCVHTELQCETAPEIQARTWARFECRRCPETYFDQWSLDKHSKDHPATGPIRERYEMLEKLIMTQGDTEKSRRFEKTVIKMAAKSEEEVPFNEKLISCWSCHNVFTTSQLRNHLKELPSHLHDWHTLICERCQATIIGRKQARKHFLDNPVCAEASGIKDQHSRADNYLCHPCGKVFREVQSLEVHMKTHLEMNCGGQDPDVIKTAQTSNVGPHLLISKDSTSTNVNCQQNNWCYDFVKKLRDAVPESSVVKIFNQHRCPVCERGFLCPLTLKEHQYTCQFRLC